jgi:anti-sigma regulatory factor (Ser/Thr protein kinase)
MATVELRFSAQPEHVRTARLVAAAVARRAGVDEAVLDEVRLAVGEACSRAVGLHRSHGVTAPVRVVLTEEEKVFSIEVGDEVPGQGGAGASVPGVRSVPDPSAPGVTAGTNTAGTNTVGTNTVGTTVGTSAVTVTDTDSDDAEDEMGLAVISGLVDDVEVTSTETGGVIRMSWPTTPATVLP